MSMVSKEIDKINKSNFEKEIKDLINKYKDVLDITVEDTSSCLTLKYWKLSLKDLFND